MARPWQWSTVSDSIPALRPLAAVGGEPLLDDRDVEPGLELLEKERRPEPGQPGADDGHLGLLRAVDSAAQPRGARRASQ